MTHHKSFLENHLIGEKSPYLLQHLNNPVDWYPWCANALNKAQAENKPIFVSIGYSTCHWCHVMAHESFEDEQVADKLNRSFVSVKVDREERPDIDEAFMHACHLINRHGGWPLNLFLTPEGKPFHAMTYAPKQSNGHLTGFIDIIDKIAELWQVRPEELQQNADQLTQAISNRANRPEMRTAEESILKAAAHKLTEYFDEKHAGFGGAPKFPQPHNAALLLRLAQRFNDPELQSMALTTLDNIKRGGITDQLGGGLHRYSVDEKWLVPHFEKMLYDQALITEAYLDAWQADGDPRFKNAAEQTLDYVLRELQHHQGGFYCGEDADSEGSEGSYYLWTQDQLKQLLNQDDYRLLSHYHPISSAGHFEGKNILYRHDTYDELARLDKQFETDSLVRLQEIHSKLLDIRSQRERPHLDDKILTGWNGLIIAALARASSLLGRDDYLTAADKAVKFIFEKLSDGRTLKRRYRDGETKIDAFFEDYAYFIHGLLELFFAVPDNATIERAIDLTTTSLQLFCDEQGRFFDSREEFINGIGRGRNIQDGVTPAAASVMIRNLIRLSRLTGRNEYGVQAKRTLSQHLPQADQYPTAFAYLLMGLDLALTESLTLVIVTAGNGLSDEWHGIIRSFRPSLPVLIVDSNANLSERIPQLAGKACINGLTTAWLCRDEDCLSPVNQSAELKELLSRYMPLNTFIR